MDQRVAELEDTVADLKEELRDLRSDFRRLRRQLSEEGREREREDLDSRSLGGASLRSGGGESVGSYSVVTGSASVVRRPFNEDASRSRTDSAPGTPDRASVSGSEASRGSTSRCALSWLEREAICDEIAAYVRRCLEGSHRGSSGRDRIQLPSRIWLVFRDFSGNLYQPVKVCRSWGECKALVKRNEDTGESIFVGLPSEREACRVAGVSGVGWPIGR